MYRLPNKNIFVFILIVSVIIMVLLLGACNSKQKKKEVSTSTTSTTQMNCSNLIANLEICSKEKKVNQRFDIDRLKNWIREDCEQLGKDDSSLQSKLLQCVHVECEKMAQCLNRFLQERKP